MNHGIFTYSTDETESTCGADSTVYDGASFGVWAMAGGQRRCGGKQTLPTTQKKRECADIVSETSAAFYPGRIETNSMTMSCFPYSGCEQTTQSFDDMDGDRK